MILPFDSFKLKLKEKIEQIANLDDGLANLYNP